MSILSIAAAIKAAVEMSVLIGINASPRAELDLVSTLTSILPTFETFCNSSTVSSTSSASSLNQPSNPISKEDEEVISTVKKVFQEINETLEAMVFDKSMKKIVKIPISEILKKISNLKDGNLLVLDGIVTPRLVEAANKSGIKYIIGHRTRDLKKLNPGVRVQTFSDMGLISQPISSS